MPEISIQFHALPGEIAKWLETWQDRYRLDIVSINYFPSFHAHRLTGREVSQQISARSCCPDEMSASLKMHLFGANNFNDFCEANPERMRIYMPVVSPSGIREAIISAASNEPESIAVWKAIKKDVRDRTSPGMWVLNPKQRIKSFVERLRYTAGVKAMAQQGVALLPVAGGNLIFLDEPTL